MAVATFARPRTPRSTRAGRSRSRTKAPLEYSILYTATLCLLAAGAVMVYSASSAESVLRNGDPAFYLKRYLMFGALGLATMHLISRRNLRLARNLTPVLLVVSFVLTAAVKVPHVGVSVNGATRWLGAGPVQFEPSELLKVSLVMYAAGLLAARPSRLASLKTLCRPMLLVVGAACLLLLAQPDMGTAMVVCFATVALLVAAGVKMRHLAAILAVLAVLALIFALAEPYRRARLLSFLHPWNDAGKSGFQGVQAMIALGSGGIFGVGLGESVQKIFYLPEAHTDMILAIVGEELGLIGISALAAVYGLIGYAGFRAAKLARDRYAKLLAAGITSLILCQAALNFFAVLGMAPLTGVPLPFVSYGSSNLVVLLGAMGLLLNVAATGGAARHSGGRLEAIPGGGDDDADSDRRRRDGRSRGARARDRRRAAG
ncbi:MAG: putative lipid II flippase FtsW [Actinobacteria bacterium]|nr:MAG: putative lipid II flippase FtsW [Actinomycetota bacterium]